MDQKGNIDIDEGSGGSDIGLHSTSGASWGVFRITPKKTGDVATGFQAACPFHRLNKKTGCKRVFRYTSHGVDDVKEVLRQMMWWS